MGMFSRDVLNKYTKMSPGYYFLSVLTKWAERLLIPPLINNAWSAQVTLSCLTLCDPLDGSPAGSSVHGILQARILEWAAMPPPGDLPNPGIKLLHLLHWQMGSLLLVPPGKPLRPFSSLTRDWTFPPCFGRWSVSHWTAREFCFKPRIIVESEWHTFQVEGEQQILDEHMLRFVLTVSEFSNYPGWNLIPEVFPSNNILHLLILKVIYSC